MYHISINIKRNVYQNYFVASKISDKDGMLMTTSANAYLDYCQATILQNRIESHAARFTGEPLIDVCLLMFVVGLLKDKSLSWIKFLDDMHTFVPHEHEHLFFARLKFMCDHDQSTLEACV